MIQKKNSPFKIRKPFLILVTGSRKFTDKDLLVQSLMYYVNLYPNVRFRHGGAKGADSLVSEYFNNIESVMRPEYSGSWTWEDRKAPFKRNIEMLETDPIPNLVCAFFYEKRKGGTLHQVNEAKKRNIPVVEFIQLTKQKPLLV